MVNFNKHTYSKTIKLSDVDGVEEDYTFVALGAKYLPKLFKVINKFSGVKQDSTPEEIMEKMDESTIELLTELQIAMVMKSYESITEQEAETFVGAHFNDLTPVLFDVNINKGKN